MARAVVSCPVPLYLEDPMAKTYIVSLTDEERTHLETLTKTWICSHEMSAFWEEIRPHEHPRCCRGIKAI